MRNHHRTQLNIAISNTRPPPDRLHYCQALWSGGASSYTPESGRAGDCAEQSGWVTGQAPWSAAAAGYAP